MGKYSKVTGEEKWRYHCGGALRGHGTRGQRRQKQTGNGAHIIITCAEISKCALSTAKHWLAKKRSIPVAGATADEGIPFQKIKLILMRAGARTCIDNIKLDNANLILRWVGFIRCARALLFWVPRGNGEPKRLVDWLPTTTRFSSL